jgi:hypothetical protein
VACAHEVGIVTLLFRPPATIGINGSTFGHVFIDRIRWRLARRKNSKGTEKNPDFGCCIDHGTDFGYFGFIQMGTVVLPLYQDLSDQECQLLKDLAEHLHQEKRYHRNCAVALTGSRVLRDWSFSQGCEPTWKNPPRPQTKVKNDMAY